MGAEQASGRKRERLRRVLAQVHRAALAAVPLAELVVAGATVVALLR
ncbi:hypothetical protein [Streptomyces sp. NBC_01244]|nr:hypothetical protein OG247_44555 [Streptomyces sp. NBC_01244]